MHAKCERSDWNQSVHGNRVWLNVHTLQLHNCSFLHDKRLADKLWKSAIPSRRGWWLMSWKDLCADPVSFRGWWMEGSRCESSRNFGCGSSNLHALKEGLIIHNLWPMWWWLPSFIWNSSSSFLLCNSEPINTSVLKTNVGYEILLPSQLSIHSVRPSGKMQLRLTIGSFNGVCRRTLRYIKPATRYEKRCHNVNEVRPLKSDFSVKLQSP